MAIGLSRKSNLSEKKLNLSEAIQKLYAPGIQDDIELFSLSSQIKSFISSGTEEDTNSQIIGMRSESLVVANVAESRTKFLTKEVTYSTGDRVYFDTFELPLSRSDLAVNPVFSKNGSLPAVRIIYSGRGFYFTKAGTSNVPQEFSTDRTMLNVVLRGRSSGSESARATVVFKVDQNTQYTTSSVSTWKIQGETASYTAGQTNSSVLGTTNTLTINSNGTWTYTSPDERSLSTAITVEITYANSLVKSWTILQPNQSATDATGAIQLAPINAPDYLTKWTGYYTLRFYIDSITITNPGKNYIVGEDLEIVETVVTDNDTGALCVLVKQVGEEYFGTDPIIVSQQRFYRVVNASKDGFFLFDDVKGKHIFLDNEVAINNFSNADPRELRVIREDFILVDNIFQLKFIQSRIYIENYGGYRVGDSLTGEVYSLSRIASNLRDSSYRAIQNTKRPTDVKSEENTLGFEYNKIIGQSATIWQRFIIRDQDFIIGTAGVTGDKLGELVNNFKLSDPDIRVPGLFIKVGNEYKRAYSTTDKPFSEGSGDNILNPNLDGDFPDYALYAANRNSGVWYGYNTTLSKFAQRLDPNGVNGAFYFHKSTAPAITTKAVGGVTYYEAPLFTFIP